MKAILNIDTMNKTVKIYSLGQINSGVSNRTNEPWASREVVLTILDPANDMQETYEKVVVNFRSRNKEQLEELQLDSKMVVKLIFHASLYDKTKRWYNNISVNVDEIKRIY